VAALAHKAALLETLEQLIRVVVVVPLMTKALQVRQVVRAGLA
jgi:hypothetical protein